MKFKLKLLIERYDEIDESRDPGVAVPLKIRTVAQRGAHGEGAQDSGGR